MISAGHAWPKDEPEVRFGECRCQSAYGDWAEIFPAQQELSNHRFGTVNQSLQENSLVGGLQHGFYFS